MTRGSSSERSSVRDMVLPAPRESVSFFSGSALARLSERVTSCRRAVRLGVGELGLGLRGRSRTSGRTVPAAAAPRSATLVVDGVRSVVGAERERAAADCEAGRHDRHRRERQRGLERGPGRASSLEARCFRPVAVTTTRIGA